MRNQYDEALAWFARARTSLEQAGERPLRAIVDYDEGLMYQRRADAGDLTHSRALLEVAVSQFRALSMTGWITRTEEALASS